MFEECPIQVDLAMSLRLSVNESDRQTANLAFEKFENELYQNSPSGSQPPLIFNNLQNIKTSKQMFLK